MSSLAAIGVEFRALPVWPHGRTAEPMSRWSFRAGWSDTIALLGGELNHMNASGVVLSAGFHDTDIRRDGVPRAHARSTHNGVELTFDVDQSHNPLAKRGRYLINRYGGVKEAMKVCHPDVGGSAEDMAAINAAQEKMRLFFATDAYELWQHNVRAIALSLKAMRAIDRYGATQGKQYAGFRQLTAGSAT